MESGALSGWWTSAVHLGLTNGYAPGSAFESPVPPAWPTAGLNLGGGEFHPMDILSD